MEARLAHIAPAPASFLDDFLEGLGATPKHVPCKYFYDAEGSRLFEAICELPEYYQTRTETALLAAHANEIAALAGEAVEIVEFGAGALRKVRILLAAVKRPAAYIPIDISGAYLARVTARLAAEYPRLHLKPVTADFTQPSQLPPPDEGARRIGFFPGGTIGNFAPEAAVMLLRRMRQTLGGGGLLIGVDLVKDPALLHAAYNDAAGITARFNKNLLARANRELGADFEPHAFAHYAPYNPDRQRIEMYLVSLCRQNVTVAGSRFPFAEGEALHTEDSHKYTAQSFQGLAVRAGFVPRAVWTDQQRLFSIHWLESR
jgi:dimethylhistidine N-methyltransferase